MEGSWNFEAGSGVGKVYMAMCGASYELWVGVNGEYRDRVGEAFEVSVYSYRETMVSLMYGDERQ